MPELEKSKKKKKVAKAPPAADPSSTPAEKQAKKKPSAPKKKKSAATAAAKRQASEAAAAQAEAAVDEHDGGVPEMPPQSDEEGVNDITSEYDSYSSDDEDGQLTRVGDVPLAWYRDEDHAGYDIEGNRIVKKTKDALSQLISKFDDPNEMITVYEKLTGEGHKLSGEDIQVLLNLQKNVYPDPSYDPYPEALRFIDWKQNPFDKGTPGKARFQPSRHDMKAIAKLVRKLRRLEKNPPPPKPDPDAPFLLWNDTEDPNQQHDQAALRRRQHYIGPPKAQLPSTAESYNPPLEYLPTEEEKQAIDKEEPVDRPEFVPQHYDSLRRVPFYRNTLRERYQRCLDLYAFTRKRKEKVNIVPDSLLPQLPKPEELRPFPQKLGFVYKGHTGPVRAISVSHNGQFLASACDDHFARVYEVCTGRLVVKWNMKAPVSCVAFNPNPALNVLAIAADKILAFAVPRSCAVDAVNEASVEFIRGGFLAQTKNDTSGAADAINLVSAMKDDSDDEEEVGPDLDEIITEDDAGQTQLVDWRECEGVELKRGFVTKAVHHYRIKHFVWHPKGDYMGTLCPKDQKSRQVVLLQVSARSSISPFKRFKETVQALSFHPTQPYLLIATKRMVRIYNLVASQLVKKLKSSVNSVSSVDCHPEGDHVLVGSHDSAVMWYDLDYADKPYKKLNSQRAAVHTVRYHPQTSVYPLFASAGDSGQIQVFHGRVFDDLTKNAFLVPLKIIKGHNVVESVGILHLAFHPTLPWLFSAGADGAVKCWTE
ncbi:Ribosome biogenesis protein BOP1-like protein [Diplonema papillatum]|nr:Ribosome biogenesis protein BOP1-like protein [Diplonema papillatum]KAJ9454628.1 Ribosome biogenesis protein BOP1-like protein [Diplonema papillatum]KAJ9454629.1 Ribosome biogenesis protein BOP1-like protein [Diplonema papillatum]